MDHHLRKAMQLGIVAFLLVMMIGVYLMVSFGSMNGQFAKCGTDTSSNAFCGTIDPYSDGDENRIANASQFIGKEFDFASGGRIFKTHCAACHAINKKIIGPPMNGLLDRIPSEEYLELYLTDQSKLLNNPYFQKIEEYDASDGDHSKFMPVTEQEREDLIGFILSVE